MKDLKRQLEDKQNDIKVKQLCILDGQSQLDVLDIQIKEQKNQTDKAQHDLDVLIQKVTRKDFVNRLIIIYLNKKQNYILTELYEKYHILVLIYCT